MYIRKLTKQVILDYGQAEVQTEAGWLRGVISDGTYVFRGIEYAEADRFHLPRKVTPWEGVKEAIVYGNACPELYTVVPHDQYTVPHYFTVQSEDCQYLNVWTQHLDKDAKRPVMVWFHGGGMMTGSGVEHYAYDGEEASKYSDVVVVTLNHRLNVLGFLDLSAYGEEYKYSGNAGIADLVAALQWVHDNIANFGGDPDNVMIFGQSGGGSKVAAMLQSPAAAGLFKRAVLQSGGMRKGADIKPETSRKVAEYVLEYLKITPDRVKELETVWYDELALAATYALQKVAQETGGRAMFGPVADGDYYYGHPFNVGFRPETKDVAVMCGNVAGEFKQNFTMPVGEGPKNTWTDEYAEKIIREQLGDDADAVMAAFKKAYPDKKVQDCLFIDADMRRGAVDFATLRSESTDAPVYNFYFALESPFNGGTLPWHNAEIPYTLHNAEYLEPSFIPGTTQYLQDIVARAWANFAGKGDPNGCPVPEWKPFTKDAPNTMIFDKQCKLVQGHDAELLKVYPNRAMNLNIMGRKK